MCTLNETFFAPGLLRVSSVLVVSVNVLIAVGDIQEKVFLVMILNTALLDRFMDSVWSTLKQSQLRACRSRDRANVGLRILSQLMPTNAAPSQSGYSVADAVAIVCLRVSRQRT